jgi:hypothetical protein
MRKSCLGETINDSHKQLLILLDNSCNATDAATLEGWLEVRRVQISFSRTTSFFNNPYTDSLFRATYDLYVYTKRTYASKYKAFNGWVRLRISTSNLRTKVLERP